MSDIQRFQSSARLSRVVVHNQVAYVAGVTARDCSGDAQAQTADILERIDAYLESVGSDKSRLLSAQVWVQDIQRDFAGLNAAWESWLPPGAAPARATCQAQLALPEIRVEIIVTAAI